VYGIYLPYESYRGVGGHQPLTQEQEAVLFLASTVAMPGTLLWRGPAAINRAWKGWKLRQAVLAGGLLSDSTGVGGPSEPLISTESPQSPLVWKASEHTSTLAAAGNSAHGGRRSGSKPRKRCPSGYRWNGRRCVKR